jgi:hypothetical protein
VDFLIKLAIKLFGDLVIIFLFWFLEG